MPVLRQEVLKAYFKGIKGPEIPPVYLIFGEPYLSKRAMNEVLQRLLPMGEGFDYEPLDGAIADVREAIQKVATFSLFSGKKVVALLDAKFFFSKADSEVLFSKAKDNYQNENIRQAARYFLTWMAASRLDFDAFSESAIQKGNKIDPSIFKDETWFLALMRYCRENALSIPDVKGDAGILEDAIRKGFPKGNMLIITASRVDRRQGLYQAIAEKGIVVDCSIPTGNTAVEKKSRDAILKGCALEILQTHQKTLEPEAYAVIFEMTGHDLPILMGNLEKLIAYSGARSRITVQDVRAVLSRTREDPIFELTGAVMERRADEALIFLNSLFKSDFHPIAILSALANQVRKLIVVKEFTEGKSGAVWRKGCDFKRFKEAVIPRLEAYEQEIEMAMSDWEKKPAETPASGRGKRKSSEKAATDLMLIRGGINPYSVFKLFQSSDRFEKDELINALIVLRDTDRLLKSTALPPRILLEKALLAVCEQDNGSAMPAKERK